MKSLKLRDIAVYNKKPNYIIDVGRNLEKLGNGEWFTSFSRFLPTSRAGYHAAKPIESVVYYLLYT